MSLSLERGPRQNGALRAIVPPTGGNALSGGGRHGHPRQRNSRAVPFEGGMNPDTKSIGHHPLMVMVYALAR